MSEVTPPDVIPVKRSYALLLWIVWVAGAAAGLSLLLLPRAAGMAACGILLLYAWWTVRLHALQQRAVAITALRCVPDALSYQLRSGKWFTGTVLSGGLVSRLFTVVRVEDAAAPSRIRYLVLVADQLTANQYRQLRVHLRWAVSGRRESADS